MSLSRVEVVTVGELKALLEGFDDDMPVGFGYQYGDYWRSTAVGSPLDAEEKVVKWSANLEAVIVAREQDVPDDGEEHQVWVVIGE